MSVLKFIDDKSQFTKTKKCKLFHTHFHPTSNYLFRARKILIIQMLYQVIALATQRKINNFLSRSETTNLNFHGNNTIHQKLLLASFGPQPSMIPRYWKKILGDTFKQKVSTICYELDIHQKCFIPSNVVKKYLEY